MARQDPWDLAPVVPLPSAEAAQPERGQVVRRPDGSSYIVASREFTNETATQLLNQGYEKQPDGVWAKTVGTVAYEDAPWNQAPVVPVEEVAQNFADSQAVGRGLEALDSATIGLPVSGAYGRSIIEQAPFLQDAALGLGALISGRSVSDLRRVDAMADQYDRENSGFQRNLGGVAGFSASLAIPGAQGSALRAAGTGAGIGALYGAGTGNEAFADRGDNAVLGALAGGAIGGATQAGVNYASRLAGISGIASGRPAPVRGDPQTRAAIRIANSLEDTGGAVTERQRLSSLGVSPTVADVGGGTVERLIRTAAAPAGPGANRAVGNAVARQANLKPEVLSEIRSISPIDETAEGLAESLTRRRSELARTEYAQPYSQRVTVPDEVRAVLSDEAGRAALRAARADAAELRDAEQLADIDALLNADMRAGPLPEVSAATLDRVVQATRERVSRFAERGLGARAAGAYGRREIIDSALDTVPGLDEARSTYRGISQQIDALDPRNALDVFEDPRDFARRLRDLTPEAREAAIVRVRQDLADVIGGQRNAGTGSLDQATQSAYARQNLEALLGSERANQLVESITARVQQSQRAQRISPNTNSQTFGRAIDEQSFNAADTAGAIMDAGRSLTLDVPSIARTVDRVRARVSMTPEERDELVRLGLGSADELERIVMLADQARARGRPLPREVRRFVERVETRFGAPTSDAILQALQPMRSAAEEERQPQ